jgi:sugar O-acyltransferase (sialic acid O-acetyltransferase NeuD family)
MPSIAEKPLVAIWGASGHARVVADIVRLQGKFRIAGFIDDLNLNRRGARFCEATILGGREQLSVLRRTGVTQVLLGFGDCKARLELTRFLEAEGFSLPIAIHPRAVVAAEVEMDSGTVIAAGAVVNPGVKIGRSVIINTSASVDHDCVIGDAAHICPGVHLAGRVEIGEAAQIGIGATVVDGVHIGTGTLIGAGAVVVGDIPDEVVAYGVPATIKKR